MAGTVKKKKFNIVQICIGILAVVLAALIIVMMGIVSDIQGTARIVNYAGLVRGKTQRIVKLEISGRPVNNMIDDIDSFIDGLRNGNKELDLVRLEDKEFQAKMKELDDYFADLKQEIQLVREKGYEDTIVIQKSEHFFKICDEATHLAESYSQRKASSLAILEKYIIADIVFLMLLIGFELVKAVRYVAMNRKLQQKVYLDSATGLPNKNKCEELLNAPEIPPELTGVISFDLNNLRRINNSMGHEAGDAYIRRFAVCLRTALPKEHFVGRNGGDEFVAITYGLDLDGMHQCLKNIREAIAEDSKNHPGIPLSYAAGYALASEYPEYTIDELYMQADKNMYIDKNHVKREETMAERHQDFQMLKLLNHYGSNFSDCLYCDAKTDTYRTIRESENFFLASDGCYSGAVEQILDEHPKNKDLTSLRDKLPLPTLRETMKTKDDVLELPYGVESEGCYNRLTLIPVDWANGELHHFLLAFETIRKTSDRTDAKEQLQLYYEQLKQSILENDSYVDAMLALSDTIYTVNLTKDLLEKNIVLKGKTETSNTLFMEYPLPCSYSDYCREYMKKVTKETLGNYRINNNSTKLLNRFAAGDTHISTEYCVMEDDGRIRWIRKMVLMTQTLVFNPDTKTEEPNIYAIILIQDTSQLHAKEEQEHARLQAAFDEMRTANRAKTDFLSRMSHDIRTPLNGIIGLLKIDEDHFDNMELVKENHRKMSVAAGHLLSLINDVLQMSKLEEGNLVLSKEIVDMEALTKDVVSIISNRALAAEVELDHGPGEIVFPYPYIYGSPLHIRQILLNIYGNCIKYNRPGGKVITKITATKEKDGFCTYCCKISDTGVGMSEEFLKHIFDPFAQEKSDARSVYQGTGLGMTIVKGLVEQMNGKIEITSKLGVGSTFTITVPFEIAPPPEEKAVKEPVKEASIEGMHLLLAEDNELNAEIAEMMLEDRGAKLTRVENGIQAVSCFRENPPGTFDAILMDIMMPVMNGLDAARAIRKLPREDAGTIPIIAMTANAFMEDVKKCLAAGMNAHLAKPFKIEDVTAALVKYRRK